MSNAVPSPADTNGTGWVGRFDLRSFLLLFLNYAVVLSLARHCTMMPASVIDPLWPEWMSLNPFHIVSIFWLVGATLGQLLTGLKGQLIGGAIGLLLGLTMGVSTMLLMVSVLPL